MTVRVLSHTVICPKCNGTGREPVPQPMPSEQQRSRICRTCHGRRVVRKPVPSSIWGAGLALCLVLLCGCARWQQTAATALEAAARGGKAAYAIARPVLHERCLSAARKCKAAGDTTCKPYRDCDARRHRLFQGLDGIEAGVDAARALLSAAIAAQQGDTLRDKLLAGVAKLGSHLAALRQDACDLGVKALCGGD